VKRRVGGLFAVIREAATTDGDIGALWDRIQTEFYETQRLILESLQEKGALREGLDAERAADIVWTLNHPSVYLLFANERGWSTEDYEKWLADAFCSLVLPARLPS
jgi:hypothetical protein